MMREFIIAVWFLGLSLKGKNHPLPSALDVAHQLLFVAVKSTPTNVESNLQIISINTSLFHYSLYVVFRRIENMPSYSNLRIAVSETMR